MTETKKPVNRIKMPRQEMEIQDPIERINNFQEVSKGFTDETAKLEAERCLQCAKPLCVQGCRVHANIPEIIRLIREDRLSEAYDIIKKYNPFPVITCRVCPQENQCEGSCILGKRSDPIAIGALERYVVDKMRETGEYYTAEKGIPKEKRIAVIGSGPAGLGVSKELVKLGYKITIYEAFHIGGGVLAYGIPEYRLPKEIVKDELNHLASLGVRFEYNTHIGTQFTLEDIQDKGYDAIFIGIGVTKPMNLRIEGDDMDGVIDAQEYLKRVNLVKSYGYSEDKVPLFRGKHVTVIGAGNVAMDAARTAKRLDSESVTIVYRRSIEQSPACQEEIHHTQEEQVNFQFLTNPVKFISDENGHVKEMEVISMELGEPDRSGRARPIPIEGSNFIIPTDLVILATGNEANDCLTSSCPELQVGKWGNIEIDSKGMTNLEGVYAGGDIVTGADTVANAIVAAKNAAKNIHRYLCRKGEEQVKACINYYYIDECIV